MGYFVLYMKSSKVVEDEERKSYLNSLYGDYLNRKYGMIEKFAKATGFADVMDDFIKEYPTLIEAKVKSPENYKVPDSMLMESMHIDTEKKGIVKFVVKDEVVEHPVKKYSYYTYQILVRFMAFLKKVYPTLIFEIEEVDKYSPKLKTFILDWFYKNMGLDGIHYTVECSAHRLLSQAELSFIENRLKQLYKYPFHIEQHWCDTCYGYHKDSPYHIEVIYD